MKKNILHLFLFLGVLITISACKKTVKDEAYPTAYSYEISVSSSTLSKAPALQSFAHGTNGADWLLFAGRTNRSKDDGGLHGIINGDYAAKSFLPPSFNEDIFVYNVENDKVWSMSFDDMLASVKSYKSSNAALAKKLKEYATVFRNSNPLVTQDGDFLYLVGGYGTPLDATTKSSAYQTFDHVARIHVPSIINLVKGENVSEIDWSKIFSFGRDVKLKSTGAEIFMIEGKLYLAGGHDFGKGALNGQKYVDAVYPFSVTPSSASPIDLNIIVDAPITDVPVDSLKTAYSDNHSTFRRRDGPVVQSLFTNSGTGNLTEGLTFYSGVFQPDSAVHSVDAAGKKKTTNWRRAWRDAIYVHPVNNASTSYTVDSNYDQENKNVYACADFGVFDEATGKIHTFLIGGIGDGLSAGPLQVSGFTNGAMQITFDINNMSSKWSVKDNIFNSENFYGAESAFIYNTESNITLYNAHSGAQTELVDSKTTFTGSSSVELGYVYGGIESFEPNPGTFGPKKSRASNKIWKVTLTRTPIEFE